MALLNTIARVPMDLQVSVVESFSLVSRCLMHTKKNKQHRMTILTPKKQSRRFIHKTINKIQKCDIMMDCRL